MTPRSDFYKTLQVDPEAEANFPQKRIGGVAVKLKDGTTSAGKRILIDGQQRVTALMASLLGIEVLNDDEVHASTLGHVLREELQRLDAAGGGADADDGKRAARMPVIRLGDRRFPRCGRNRSRGPGKTSEVFGTPYSPAAANAPSTIVTASFSIIRR